MAWTAGAAARPFEAEADDGCALVEAARSGDRRAFAALYARFARTVHGILLSRVPRPEVEDLVQDVFVLALQQMHTLRTAAAFPGWLAAIAKERQPRRQIYPYRELRRLFAFYRDWEIALFDAAAADQFEQLQSQKVRVGTMDLKIAAIALAENGRLLTRNTSDFSKVPGLVYEDWSA